MTTNDLYFLMDIQYMDLKESLEKYLEEVDAGNAYGTYGNRDYGKTVVKRKIIALRQTLLRIEKELK